MTDFTFDLASGRKIGISNFGDPGAARVVMLCNPTGGSGAFDPDPQITTAHGIRVIVVDRPGYGASEPLDPHELPTVEQCADDIAEFLTRTISTDSDGGRRAALPVGAIGWGWGGATALSLAARHPDLVDRLVVVGTVRPSRAGRGETDSPILESTRPSSIVWVPAAAESLRGREARDALESLGANLSDPLLANFGLLSRIDHLMTDEASDGMVGVASDRIAARDTTWAAALPRITAKTLILAGTDDPIAGPDDARWYGRAIPGSEVTVSAAGSRLLIVAAWDRVLTHLAGSPVSRSAPQP